MYEYKVVIDRWVDGDTVDVDIDLGFDVVLKKQRVRLHGINAPESRTRDLEEKEKGLAAKEYCKNFCKEGEAAILKTKTYKALKAIKQPQSQYKSIKTIPHPLKHNYNSLNQHYPSSAIN